MRGTLALTTLLALAVPVKAQEAKKCHEYVENRGIAFSIQLDEKSDVVTAYDTVAAYDDYRIAVADCDKHSVLFRGVKWCFVSAANQQAFINEMGNKKGNKYLPFVGGHCAQGVSNGNLCARGDPRTAVRVSFSRRPQDDVLVVNGGFEVRRDFFGDSAKGIAAARIRWDMAKQMGMYNSNSQPSQ